jgi:hypothetical protein
VIQHQIPTSPTGLDVPPLTTPRHCGPNAIPTPPPPTGRRTAATSITSARLGGLLLALLSFLPCGPALAQSLTAAQAKADIALARSALEAIHPGYDRYTPRAELDAAWDALIAELDYPAQTSSGRLYRRLSSVLALIRCGHTLAELPPLLHQQRRSDATFFPFRLRLFDGRAYVFDWAGDGAQVSDGIELLAIDGRPIGDILADILPLMPLDGFTEHTRARTFEASAELMGSGFEQFYPLFYGSWWTRGSAALTLRAAGEEQEVRVVEAAPITFPRWSALDADGRGDAVEFHDGVHFELLDGNIGLLQIDSFVNYRQPVDPDEVFAPIFAALAEAQVDTLILDTRANGGGSDEPMLALLSWLQPEPFTLLDSKRVMTIDLSPWAAHLDTWDPAALVPDPARFEPRPDGMLAFVEDESTPLLVEHPGKDAAAFDGRLVILTSERNSSGVTMLLTALRQRPQTAMVGEPTGGSSTGPTAGVIYFLRLPSSGIRVRIPWIRQTLTAPGTEGFGITPDVRVERSLADTLAGRDPARETALTLARRRFRPGDR